MAARGLRHIAYLESVPGAPPPPITDDENLSKRHLIYEQLGDPRVIIVGAYLSQTLFHPSLIAHDIAGRVGYQKRLRKLVRLLSFPSAIHVAVWEECYWRWLHLYNFIKDTVEEASAAPDTREAIAQAVKVGALRHLSDEADSSVGQAPRVRESHVISGGARRSRGARRRGPQVSSFNYPSAKYSRPNARYSKPHPACEQVYHSDDRSIGHRGHSLARERANIPRRRIESKALLETAEAL